MNPRNAALELGQLVVVGRKQGLCAGKAPGREIFDHRPGNRKSVKGRSAAADFIENNQASLRRIAENVGDLRHLHHEGRLPGREVIRGADARENAVGDTDLRLGCRDKGTCLREQGNQSRLAHICGLSGHIRSRDDGNAIFLAVEQGVVFDKAAALHHALHHRMPPAHNAERSVRRQFRPHILIALRDIGERKQGVEIGNDAGTRLNARDLRRKLLSYLLE